MKVLLAGPGIPAAGLAVQDCDTEIVRDPLNSPGRERVAGGQFDGVICGAEGSEALEIVEHLHRHHDGAPIVLVSPGANPDFENRAMLSGASSVLAGDLAQAAVAENTCRMMALKLAAQILQEKSRRNEQLRRDLTEAVLAQKSVSQFGGHINRHWLRRGLLPLLVENDADDAFQMVKAFERADLEASLPIMRSAQEALAYLQSSPPYENRNVHPLPNAILLGLSPLRLGGELLRWIRQQQELSAIPVIVLSRNSTPDEVREAYGNLANSVLIKPADFEELVTLVRSIDVYWTRMNIGRTY